MHTTKQDACHIGQISINMLTFLTIIREVVRPSGVGRGNVKGLG